MKITKKKLMEKVNQELRGTLVENYLRNEITQVLNEIDSEISTKKVEKLLAAVIETLESIDLSIDYLSGGTF